MHIRRHLEHTDEIGYRLPISAVRITATITEADDTILEAKERTPEATIDLVVIGGEQLTARIDSNVLEDTNVAFTMTDDGVLVSSSVDSTGEAGKVVLGAVSVGATIAGAFLGAPGAVGAVTKLAHEGLAVGAEPESLLPDEPDEEQDPVMAAFAKQNTAVYRRRKRYAELVEKLQSRAADALSTLCDTDDAELRRDAVYRLRTDQRALSFARAESARLDEVFNAWRATTINTRTEAHQTLLTLDEIRLSRAGVDGAGKVVFAAADDLPSQAAKAKAEKIWTDLGVVLALERGTDDAGDTPEVSEPHEDNKILVRSPRRITLSLYRRKDDEDAKAALSPQRRHNAEAEPTAELVEAKPQEVMDRLCAVHTIVFHKSILAKRTTALTFSDLGALTGIATTRTAAAAALADTAQAIPGTVAASLEEAKKLSDDVGALRDRAIDARLAELKKEVAVKQNEIALAGLHATEAQSAELTRLQQQEAILKAQKTLAGYAIPAGGDGGSVRV